MRGQRVLFFCLSLSLTIASSACSTSARRPAPRRLDVVVGCGVDDIGILQSEHHTSPVGMLELRGPRVWRALRPMAGVQYDGDGSSLAYGGAGYEIDLGCRLRCTPSFAVGYFHSGTTKSGGSDHQFRSAVEFSYALHKGQRVGLVVQHVSNGGFAKPNPGMESVLLTYSLPVR